MDWENERYVRIYVRDTADLMAIGWEGRAMLWELIRKADRSGVVDGESDTLPDLLRLPRDVVEAGLPRLLQRKVLKAGFVGDSPAFVMVNYVPAQEAKQSDKQRQAESRARRRAAASGVTFRDNESQHVVTKRDENVTTGHKLLSRSVTPSLAEPSLAVTNRSEKAKPSSNGSRTFSAEIAEVWEHFVGLWRKKRGKGAEPKLSDQRKAKIKARLSEGYSVDRLKLAADGMWGREHNLEGGYLSAELCYRSADKVEMYEGFATPQHKFVNPMSLPQDYTAPSNLPPREPLS